MVEVDFDEPPPTEMPLANVPTAPPTPNAPATAPKLRLPPPELPLDVVEAVGI